MKTPGRPRSLAANTESPHAARVNERQSDGRLIESSEYSILSGAAANKTVLAPGVERLFVIDDPSRLPPVLGDVAPR